MRRMIALLIISLISFLFILPEQASAHNSLRALYQDAVDYNNVFALFEVAEHLANDPAGYQIIGVNESDFVKTKEVICRNYLNSVKNDLHVTEDLLREVRLACNEQSSLALKF